MEIVYHAVFQTVNNVVQLNVLFVYQIKIYLIVYVIKFAPIYIMELRQLHNQDHACHVESKIVFSAQLLILVHHVNHLIICLTIVFAYKIVLFQIMVLQQQHKVDRVYLVCQIVNNVQMELFVLNAIRLNIG